MGREQLERLIAAELDGAAYRVRRDAARAPQAWRPIFEQLEQRLFDPELRVKKLRQQHRLARTAATDAFEARYGCEPGEYVTRRRIETVKALLRIEGLTVWECGQRVGFTSRSGFEAAYHRLCGEAPTTTRANAASKGMTVAPEPPAEARAALRQLLNLQDPPEAIVAACRALRARSRAALLEKAESAEAYEQRLAEEWWERARDLPSAELRVLAEGRLETPAAFERLCRAIREEGRADRQRGVEFAEVALESLAPLRGRLEASRLAELEVKGLAELGNAYRLVFDYSAAEQAFAWAEQRLEKSLTASSELQSDLIALKASLYHDERRLEEALMLTHRALPLAGTSCRLKAEILIRQGSIQWRLGSLTEAIADFRTAFELLIPEREPYLTWLAAQNLAMALHSAGDNASAQVSLERAEPIVRSLGQAGPMCLRHWLMGLLAAAQGDLSQAEMHLCRAHGGYETLGDRARAAVISLDLASLYLRLDRAVEAAQLTAEALPQLRSLGLAAEGIVALNLLQQALETEALSAAILEKVRGCASRAVSAPELRPAEQQQASPLASPG